MQSWAWRCLLVGIGGWAIFLCGCGGNSENDLRRMSRKRDEEPEVAAPVPQPKPAPVTTPAEGAPAEAVTPAAPPAIPIAVAPPTAVATNTGPAPTPPRGLPPRPYIPPDDSDVIAPPVARPVIPSDDAPAKPVAITPSPNQPDAATPTERTAADKEKALVAELLAKLLNVQPDTRRAVPDTQDQRLIGEKLRDLYKNEYEAARKANDVNDFIRRMLSETSRFVDDPQANYVINDIVRKMAIGVGDLDTAMAAIHNIDEDYRVDGPQLRYDALQQLAEVVKTNGPVNLSINKHAESLLLGAVAEGKFEVAIKANELLKGTAKKALDKFAQEQARQNGLELESMKNLHEDTIEAAKMLRDNPGDAVARQAVGMYIALVQGNFEEGLPLISQGEDVRWKMVASIDLQDSKSAANVANLGDMWWSLGETVKNPLRRAAHLRAVHWYKQAIPQLANNLQRATAEGKLKEAEKLYPQLVTATRPQGTEDAEN